MRKILEKSTMQSLLPMGLIVIAAFSRLVPHWPNFTAIGAMSLFAGSVLGFRFSSILVSVLALLLTDLVFGFHSTMIAVYGATVFGTLLGASFLKSRKPKSIFAFSVINTVLFFVVTNVAVWSIDGMYPRNWNGLVQAFVMAIPFFPSQFFGDLFFGAILFGSYALLSSKSQTAKI